MFDKLTTKDKKLLVFLVMFLIVTATFCFGVKPIVTDYKENNQKIMTLNDKKTIMEGNLCMVDAMKGDNDKLFKNITDIKAKYCDMLESEEIDKLLTNMAIKCGLKSKSLSIKMPEEAESTQPYSLSKKALAEAEKKAIKSESDEESKVEEDKETESKSYVYMAQISMTIVGNETNQNSFIDELSHSNGAIEIMSVNWSEEVLNITLNIYMCKKR